MTHTLSHTQAIYTLNEHDLVATTPSLMGHEKGGNNIKMHTSYLSLPSAISLCSVNSVLFEIDKLNFNTLASFL